MQTLPRIDFEQERVPAGRGKPAAQDGGQRGLADSALPGHDDQLPPIESLEHRLSHHPE
jgi:hypothetical protein